MYYTDPFKDNLATFPVSTLVLYHSLTRVLWCWRECYVVDESVVVSMRVLWCWRECCGVNESVVVLTRLLWCCRG